MQMQPEFFIFRLYQELAKATPEQFAPRNFVFGPASLHMALLMTAVGAAGETRKQMIETLGFLGGDSLLDSSAMLEMSRKSFFDINLDAGPVCETSGPEIFYANAVYINEKFGVDLAYADTVKNSFGAMVQNADFSNGDEIASQANSFVNKQTNGKISQIVNAGDIDGSTMMLLLNAIYFKGAWRDSFKKINTKAGDFYKLDGSVMQVDYMSDVRNVQYKSLNQLNATMICLPFSNSQIEMALILPNSKNGLTDLIQALADSTDSDLKAVLERPQSVNEVKMQIPKFELQTEAEFERVMAKMGMSHAFDQNLADFSLMSASKSRELFISMIRHKAFLKIDEDGAEAAAVTAIRMGVKSMSIPQTPQNFVADHPFLVALLSSSRTPIFFGHVSQPNPSPL